MTFLDDVSTYAKSLFDDDSPYVNGMRVLFVTGETAKLYIAYTLTRNADGSFTLTAGLNKKLGLDFSGSITVTGPNTTTQPGTTTYCGALDVQISGAPATMLILDLGTDALAQFIASYPEYNQNSLYDPIKQPYSEIMTYRLALLRYDVQTFVFNSANSLYTGNDTDKYTGITIAHYLDDQGYKTTNGTFSDFFNDDCRLDISTITTLTSYFNCPSDQQACTIWTNTTPFRSIYRQPDFNIGVLLSPGDGTLEAIFILELSESAKQAFLQQYPQYAIACCLNQLVDPLASVCPAADATFFTTCDLVMDIMCKTSTTGPCVCYADQDTRCRTNACTTGSAYLNSKMRATPCPNQCLQIIDITGNQEQVQVNIDQVINGCVPIKIFKQVDSPGCGGGTGSETDTGTDTGTDSAISYDGQITDFSATQLQELRTLFLSMSTSDLIAALSQSTVCFVDTVTRKPLRVTSVSATEPFNSDDTQTVNNTFQGWELGTTNVRETLLVQPSTDGAGFQLVKNSKVLLFGLSSVIVETSGILNQPADKMALGQVSSDASAPPTELAFTVSVTASTTPSTWGSDPEFPYDISKGELFTDLKASLLVLNLGPAAAQALRNSRNRKLFLILVIAGVISFFTALTVTLLLHLSGGYSKKVYFVPLVIAVGVLVPIVMAWLNILV